MTTDTDALREAIIATALEMNAAGINSGKSAAVRFQRKGTFAYHCKIHPFMHGKIVVG